MIYHSHHSRNVTSANTFEDLAETVADAVAALTPHLDRFDALVATGVSGIVVAAPLSVALGKPLAVVRKKDDNSHSYRRLEGAMSVRDKRVLWVDDFENSGLTRRDVEYVLRDATYYHYDDQTGKGDDRAVNAKIVAHFLYRDNHYTEVTTPRFGT